MGRVGRKNAFPESLVVEIWQNRLLERTDLITEDGEPVRIIYPGRVNGDQGADLLDAVVATSQGLRKGDIEVHVKSSSWWAHQHHRDPAYNRVILHVVFWNDTGEATNLQNGENSPTLALHRYFKKPAVSSNNPVIPCFRAMERWYVGFLDEFLDCAGMERFFTKANAFQTDFAQLEPEQSLYRGIMGALGYAKNKSPFLELARRLPLQVLGPVTQGEIPEGEHLARQQALLLGTAGLLPSQHTRWQQGNIDTNGWIDKLESLWLSFHPTEAMSSDDWNFCKVRPNDFPTRRLAAMSHLLLRHKEKGILKEIVGRIREIPADKGHHELARMLLVTAVSHRAGNFGLLLPSRRTVPTLLGARRAADIIINIILPFVFSWGIFTSQAELTAKSLALYRHYPRLATNAIERHMGYQLGFNGDLVNSAQRQQGLLHIYRTLCSQGKCHCCPLGGASGG
ncbi:DUF2851 family protein [Chloroflexota bacterium]